MPGGRGTLIDVAVSLNGDDTKKAQEAIKMAIDRDEYMITGASLNSLRAAIDISDDVDAFIEIWCYALEKRKVDWGY